MADQVNSFDACGGADGIATAPPSRVAGGLSQHTREFLVRCGLVLELQVCRRRHLCQSRGYGTATIGFRQRVVTVLG